MMKEVRSKFTNSLQEEKKKKKKKGSKLLGSFD